MSDKYDEVAGRIYFDDDGQGRTIVDRIAAILREAFPAPSGQGECERALDLFGELMSYDNFEAYPPNVVERVREYIAQAEALLSRPADEMDGYQSCGPDGPEGHDAIPRPAPAAPSEEDAKYLEELLSDEHMRQYHIGLRSDIGMLVAEVRRLRAALASERARVRLLEADIEAYRYVDGSRPAPDAATLREADFVHLASMGLIQINVDKLSTLTEALRSEPRGKEGR